ncbi:DnaA ATPase domain-containing protein [Gaopeijia maritima]|uniref:Chromosomal replication initiator protein DnaA n=1 Tax=Gaopeijia maritima TaxID=3119007 RepID=A0ABU9EBH9_9BACT
MKDLDPKLTFETFVVGPANRLASAAARRAAESPGQSYNPLFVYAASGLGKSHLLMAVAHQALRDDRPLEVRYQTLEEYLASLAAALEEGTRDELRDRYRDLDILLLDDVQFLAGQAEAQEMLLGTLDAMTASGRQVILASDRPPKDINGLDARLVSRFSGGLMVDIAPPEFETRAAILRRKAEERGQSLAEGVAEAIARYPIRNVRELGGALNRILAVQELEERMVTAGDVPAFMGDAEAAQAAADTVEGAAAEFHDFLDELSGAVADAVVHQEVPWRKAYREAAEAAEREGFMAKRLRTALDARVEPSSWQGRVEGFRRDINRLREIDDELTRLRNPWPEAASSVVKDPDRVEEAEALLASVRERVRPFREVSPGPSLRELEEQLPPLPLRAAAQLVSLDKPQYNPLFLWDSEGSAARGLMASAARGFRSAFPAGRMAVTSVEDFAQDFIRALSEGVAGAWRERWWTVDLLLVYGVEKLSDTERAQDEFFHLFEALKRRGARLLLAADRPPSRVEGIDERLRSRFEGGLVVEVNGSDLGPDAREWTLVDPLPAPEDDPFWEGLSFDIGDDFPTAGAGSTMPPPVVPGQQGTSEGEERVDVPVIPPLEELDLGDGRGGLFFEASEPVPQRGVSPEDFLPDPVGGDWHEAPASNRNWRPSPERVVWRWPNPDERLVEDLA